MVRKNFVTNSFTKGVVDPALSERIDLAHYYDSLESGLNIEVFPQGGFRRRAGTTTNGQRLRRSLEPISIAGGVSTEVGDFVVRLTDQDDTTFMSAPSPTSATYELAQINLGSAQPVVFFDVIGYSCENGNYARSLAVEYWDGTNWRGFGPTGSTRKNMGSVDRTRRFAVAPGAHVSTQFFRVVIYNAEGAGVIGLGGLRLFTERRSPSAVRGFSFARTSDHVLEMILSDRNIDVFEDFRYVASVPINHDRRQIADINYNQSLDTLVLYHEDIRTTRITRQGASDEWDAQPADFLNLPSLSPGTAFSGSQDEIQEVRFDGVPNGSKFVLGFEGKFTSAISSMSNFLPLGLSQREEQARAVRGALASIGVSFDMLVESLSDHDQGFRVTFRGRAGSRRWPVLFATILDHDGADPVTTIVQRGIDTSAPIADERTGWPRCGVFYQERHLIGGFRSAPLTYGVSRFGQQFNFQEDQDPLTADVGFFGTLNSDQVETIHEIYVGRHIQIFTETGEWYIETRTLDATKPPNVLLATRYGMKNVVPIIFADNATVFVQKGGRVLRNMLYSEIEQSYGAEPLSLLGPHLLTDIVDVGYRPARSTDEGNHVVLVNKDGSVAFVALLLNQELIATTPWSTDGHYRAAFGDVLQRLWVIVERGTAAGGVDNYLERIDDSHSLDAAVHQNIGIATRDLRGLEMHEGKQVWCWTDNDIIGPLEVVDGGAALPVSTLNATTGLFPEFRCRLPRLREELPDGQRFRPKARIYEAELAMAGTGQVDMAVNGGPFRNVNLALSDNQVKDFVAKQPRTTLGVLSEISPGDELEQLLRALTIGPGSGEFVYATSIYEMTDGLSDPVVENLHNTDQQPDFLVSLGQANATLPKLENISLVVNWYGDDLRAGNCLIEPRIAQAAGPVWAPYDWSVGGLARAAAKQVSFVNGDPAYAGTPTDRSVIDAIKAINAVGKAVTLTPLLVMDIPEQSGPDGLPNPYPDQGPLQPSYPWRGRITCNPSPDSEATVDLTSEARVQINDFVGRARNDEFVAGDKTVLYEGTLEWSYRRFILHYAHLSVLAGGVDTFVIGTGMRGLTSVRDELGSYPFVQELVRLANSVKDIVGSSTNVIYAADWMEMAPHQTGVPGEIFFHLDPLWTTPAIAAIGIDNYWPLSDWRSDSLHADRFSGWSSIYDRDYLQSNIEGGEFYDWLYASQADRDAQVRTPITDEAYSKPWVYRAKDIRSWWSNHHFNRPGGIEAGDATDWTPGAKQIWFMQTGCPAVDRGANQPNVFTDPNGAENGLPYYSRGNRDDEMQRAYLGALLSYYAPGEDELARDRNPISAVDGLRMTDTSRMYVYTWDARFYPAFPDFTDVWPDASLWATGHWLNGRLFQTEQAIDGDVAPVGYGGELPLLERLVTGNVRITNLRGWTRNPVIELSQSKPAPLELRAIRFGVAHHG